MDPTVLGYEPRRDCSDEDLVDPCDRGLEFWFELIDELRGEGGANLVAIWVPSKQAQARIAAGGRWPTRRVTRPRLPP